MYKPLKSQEIDVLFVCVCVWERERVHMPVGFVLMCVCVLLSVQTISEEILPTAISELYSVTNTPGMTFEMYLCKNNAYF